MFIQIPELPANPGQWVSNTVESEAHLHQEQKHKQTEPFSTPHPFFKITVNRALARLKSNVTQVYAFSWNDFFCDFPEFIFIRGKKTEWWKYIVYKT